MAYTASSQQANSKIQGKFYPLQHQEWLKACRELTPAQRDVLYYIRTLDPRNYGIEINAAEIARQLSSPESKVHRQTVSRALKELDAKGFIDLELLLVRAKVKPKGLWCNDCEDEDCQDAQGATTHRGCDETPRSISTHHDRSPRTKGDRDTPRKIATHQAKSTTLTNKKSQHSKSNKEIKEFKDSLSDLEPQEREDFEKFVREEWKRTKKQEIDSFTAFVSGEFFQEWYQKYQSRPEVVQADLNQKWIDHPKREEWLAQIRQGKPAFIVKGGPKEERKIRSEFAKWAEANNLVWGAES